MWMWRQNFEIINYNRVEPNRFAWSYPAQGRIKGGGQRGQLPRALRSKGAPRDDIYLF